MIKYSPEGMKVARADTWVRPYTVIASVGEFPCMLPLNLSLFNLLSGEFGGEKLKSNQLRDLLLPMIYFSHTVPGGLPSNFSIRERMAPGWR